MERDLLYRETLRLQNNDGPSEREHEHFVQDLSSYKNAWELAQLALAIGRGERDENQLTNQIFFDRHPELNRRKLRKEETDLVKEWLSIRDKVVRPLLRSLLNPAKGKQQDDTGPFSGIFGSAEKTAPVRKDDPVLLKISKYDELIVAAGRKYDLHPNIIRAVIAAESGGDPLTTSRASYKGLMQAEKTDDQYDPKISIETGTKKFAAFKNKYVMPKLKNFGIDSNQIDQKTLLSLIIASYNAGHVTVLKALEYAHRTGDWKKWLQPEHYQRALVFSGSYYTYEDCTRTATPGEIQAAWQAGRRYAGWRKNSRWWEYPDPPEINVLEKTAPGIMLCWVKTKYRNTGPYIRKFLRYI